MRKGGKAQNESTICFPRVRDKRHSINVLSMDYIVQISSVGFAAKSPNNAL